MDAAMTKLLRAMMRGKACREEEGKYRSLTGEAVMRHWKVLPAKEEMAIRRLKWYQKWAKYPEEFRQ
eukprot:1914441-Lingulodinium_polyedra.AAC.1